MTDKLQFTAATDKDVYDLLMSSRQKMTDDALRIIALKRGLIYSPETPRDDVASEISLLPHDYKSISELIKVRESSKRQEKMTCISLPVELTRDEMIKIVSDYKTGASSDEEIIFQPRRARDVSVKIAYDEIDYSKTRLIQRQRKDAHVEFIVSTGATTIRMPATEKARSVAEQFRVLAERIRTEKIPPTLVSLFDLSSENKSLFFLKLMQAMPGYEFQTAVNMRVASSHSDFVDREISIDLEEESEASDEVVGIVSSVVLAGVNLEKSDEYQSLRRKGYYFTSVTWRASQLAEPRDSMQFEVSFERGVEGSGFKYAVKVARRIKKTGEVTSKFEHLEANRQPSMWRLIETTALLVIESLRAKPLVQVDAEETL